MKNHIHHYIHKYIDHLVLIHRKHNKYNHHLYFYEYEIFCLDHLHHKRLDIYLNHYHNKKDYYISFMGFTPVDDPQVLIYVTIDEPHIEHQDNARLAVGLERECMKAIVDILDIQPTRKKSSGEEKKEYYLNEFIKKNKKK